MYLRNQDLSDTHRLTYVCIKRQAAAMGDPMDISERHVNRACDAGCICEWLEKLWQPVFLYMYTYTYTYTYIYYQKKTQHVIYIYIHVYIHAYTNTSPTIHFVQSAWLFQNMAACQLTITTPREVKGCVKTETSASMLKVCGSMRTPVETAPCKSTRACVWLNI